MKKIILFIGLVVSFGHAMAGPKNQFILNGKVEDTTSGVVYIRNLISSSLDTINIEKGLFKYKGKLTEPTPHVITDEKNRYQLFFAQPNDVMDMTIRRKEMSVTFIEGSASHEIFRKLLAKQDPIQKASEYLQQAMSQPGTNRDSLQAIAMQLNNQRNANYYEFLSDYGSSEVTAFLIFSSISNDRNIDAKLADSMFSYLRGNALTSFYGKSVKKSIDKLRAVTIGYTAPDFTQPDSSGKKKYTLSGFRGKYVLVDFWASWCGPCKAEIPFMKEAYKEFHDKGFEIFSVSLDDKCDAWKNALKQFEMPWPQGSDCKGFRNEVNELYPIPSIPKTLLLDKNGKIIATDLRGPALDNKLKELLGG